MNPKNHKSTVITVGLLTLAAVAARAENETNALPVKNYQLVTVGIEAGTTGAGVAANWRFANHFGVGGAFDYFDYSYDGTVEGNQYNLKLRLMSEPLTLNLYPWKNHSFHLSVGGVFNQNHLTGNAATITINGNTYNNATLDIKQQPVNPYVAIGGNLYFDKKHHWSLGGELGAFYTGSPRFNINVPGASPADYQTEYDKIHKYAKDAQFWPVIKLSLDYSF